MKRFHGREMALLTAPVLAIGVLGLWNSKRPIEDERLRLSFSVEKPTTLEAFAGIQTAFVVGVKGKDAEKLRIWQLSRFLELHTPRGVETLRDSSWPPKWKGVWKGNTNNSRFSMNLESVPPGDLFFGLDATIAPWNGTILPGAKLPHRSGKWKVDRVAIPAFDFQNLPRLPLVELKSVTITNVAKNNLTAKTVFHLQGAAIDEKTPVDWSFSERRNRMLVFGTFGQQTETARRRVREWTVSASGFLYPGQKTPLYVVTGRVSAGNRWPLAFQIEPFDFKNVKVGQKLKFKSWAAPLPSSTKTS